MNHTFTELTDQELNAIMAKIFSRDESVERESVQRRGYIATGRAFQMVVLHEDDDVVVGIDTRGGHESRQLCTRYQTQVIDFQEPCVGVIARVVDRINKYQSLADLSPDDIVGLDNSKMLLQGLCEEILHEEMQDVFLETADDLLGKASEKFFEGVSEAIEKRFNEDCCDEADVCNNQATQEALDTQEERAENPNERAVVTGDGEVNVGAGGMYNVKEQVKELTIYAGDGCVLQFDERVGNVHIATVNGADINFWSGAEDVMVEQNDGCRCSVTGAKNVNVNQGAGGKVERYE